MPTAARGKLAAVLANNAQLLCEDCFTADKIIYPNANHAFHNDTGQSYNAKAAKDAWAKTLAWFAKYLRS